MSESVVRLQAAASTLSAKVRAQLAHLLIASLDAEADGLRQDDEQLESELHRRLRDVRDGKVTCRPVEDVLADLDRKYDREDAVRSP